MFILTGWQSLGDGTLEYEWKWRQFVIVQPSFANYWTTPRAQYRDSVLHASFEPQQGITMAGLTTYNMNTFHSKHNKLVWGHSFGHKIPSSEISLRILGGWTKVLWRGKSLMESKFKVASESLIRRSHRDSRPFSSRMYALSGTTPTGSQEWSR